MPERRLANKSVSEKFQRSDTKEWLRHCHKYIYIYSCLLITYVAFTTTQIGGDDRVKGISGPDGVVFSGIVGALASVIFPMPLEIQNDDNLC